jgi:hypothetical protein
MCIGRGIYGKGAEMALEVLSGRDRGDMSRLCGGSEKKQCDTACKSPGGDLCGQCEDKEKGKIAWECPEWA